MVDLSPMVENARFALFAWAAAGICVVCLIGWFYSPGSLLFPIAAVVFGMICFAFASQTKTSGAEFAVGKCPDHFPTSLVADQPRMKPSTIFAPFTPT